MECMIILPRIRAWGRLHLLVGTIILSIFSLSSLAAEEKIEKKNTPSARSSNRVESLRPFLQKDREALFSASQINTGHNLSDSAQLNVAYSLRRKDVPQWLNGLDSPDTLKSDQDSISQSDVRDGMKASLIINSHNDEIKQYYHDYLKLNPNLAGRMVLRIFVDANGNVKKVEISESTICEKQFEKEIMESIKQWKDFGPCSSKKLKVYRQEYVFGE